MPVQPATPSKFSLSAQTICAENRASVTSCRPHALPAVTTRVAHGKKSTERFDDGTLNWDLASNPNHQPRTTHSLLTSPSGFYISVPFSRKDKSRSQPRNLHIRQDGCRKAHQKIRHGKHGLDQVLDIDGSVANTPYYRSRDSSASGMTAARPRPRRMSSWSYKRRSSRKLSARCARALHHRDAMSPSN